MAASKTISAVGSHGWHTFTMTVTETAVNTSANTSTVNVKFTIKPKVSGYDWEGYTSNPPSGTVYFAGHSWNWSLSSYNGSSTVTLVNKTITVEHDANGAKAITGTSSNDQFRFTASSLADYYLPGSASAYGSITLTKITRYPSVTVSNTSKTETGITMKWTSDVTCNRVRYRVSTNGGSSWGTWTSKTVSAKSGSYTVSGLTANTSYTIQTELRSSASSLTSTANKTVKTYAWPYPLGTDQYVYRDGKLDIDFKNPLERNVSYVIKVGDTVIDQGETDGLGVTLWDIAEDMLPLIPNSNTGTYTVTVTYSGHTATATGTFYATGANPTITSVDYQDSNNTAQAIIQNDKTILQNVSTPLITVAGTGQYDATIVSASVTILGNTVTGSATQVQFGTINSASNVPATVTITDSRGNTASTNITITMLAYTSPSAIITIQRENNFYSETDLTVDADVMHTGSNVPTITARYREHPSGAWQNWPQITDNVTSTESLNNTKEWDVEVTVTDSFGGSTTYTGLFVGIGLPIFYIDRGMRAVSINSFPEAGQPFVVNGVDILGELLYKPGDSFELVTATLPDGTEVGGTTLPGLVTSSTKQIRLGVTVDKSLRNINSVSVSGLRGGIRTPTGGYINGNGDSTEWLTQSGITVDAFITGDKTILIRIASTSSYTNVSNNMPVSMGCGHLLLEFT